MSFLVAALILAPFAWAQTTFQLDSTHTFVIFRVSHLNAGITYGRFNDPAGTVVVGADGVPTQVAVEIKVANIDTHDQRRDGHLKGPDFFNVGQFPTISFTSTSIKAAGEGAFQMTGNLTLHGETKPISVTLKKTGESTNPQAGHRIGFETTITLDRRDYGMNFMPEMVGTEIQIIVALEGVAR
jgi:polyisoprenoid-binding protein YceI